MPEPEEPYYIEATARRIEEASIRLADAIQRQLRAIEATGRPDEKLAEEIKSEKYIVESLADQLDHAALIKRAITGEKVAMGMRKVHVKKHGTRKEKLTRWSQMQRACDELLRRRPELSWERVKQIVAKEQGCSQRTIERHCKRPAK